jgi:hypothetical protein
MSTSILADSNTSRSLGSHAEYSEAWVGPFPRNRRSNIHAAGPPDPELEQIYDLNAKRVIWESS